MKAHRLPPGLVVKTRLKLPPWYSYPKNGYSYLCKKSSHLSHG
ncbi:hypothetical protein GPEL0_01r3743 [Geoanaerobacter pelophilus]|uniref:Uncharacterized protein n=1 Tax=Geoanaerobacter pelophilus TaxID=60036 RepID=A0ABQ0MNE2_9BACT|nr:hypothetical protein GPEL0_01r3743 [Geoanaerobacter pelophilus]